MGARVLRVTPQLLELLTRRRVFFTVGGAHRWRPGEAVAVDEGCRLEPFSTLYAGRQIPRALGAFSYARSELALHAAIGRYVSIGEGVAFTGPEHPPEWATTSPVAYDAAFPAARAFLAAYDPEAPPPQPFDGGPAEIRIGHDVWIGDGAMIAGGVAIGDGAVVGARSFVREDVPPYAVVVGSPARVLRLRFPEPLVARFLALRWWRFAPDVVRRLPADDPARFLDGLEERLARDPPREMSPTPLTWDELRAATEA